MSDEKTAVLYNAECPICNFEISHYAKYSDAKGLPIRFDDLNSDALAQWDITPDQAARRLYLTKGGQLYSGIPAFLVLWRDMPRYKWLARIVGLPVIKQLAMLAYDYALAPAIYRWHIRRKAKGKLKA